VSLSVNSEQFRAAFADEIVRIVVGVLAFRNAKMVRRKLGRETIVGVVRLFLEMAGQTGAELDARVGPVSAQRIRERLTSVVEQSE
jgi:hypothetical protein